MSMRLRQCVFPLSVLLLLACFAPLRAQQPANGKSEVEFSCLVLEPLSIPAVFYRDGKTWLPLEFTPGSRSRIYNLKENNVLELFTAVTDADGKTTYNLAGKAPLVEATRRMLFVIEPASQASVLPLSVFGVDDSLDAFPPGTLRFFNFSALQLQVKFGGQTSSIPAGEIKAVKSNVTQDGGLLPIFISEAGRKIIFENRIFAQPDVRDLVFIKPPAGQGMAPRVKFVSEVIPAKSPVQP